LLATLLSFSCNNDYNLWEDDDAERPPHDPDEDTVDPDQDSGDSDTADSEDTDDSIDEPVPGEPVADAGRDQVISPLDTINLDGGASYDPDLLYPLTYRWTLKSKPAGSRASLNGSDRARPEFWADLAGEYVFELTVRNDSGIWDSTPDTVKIVAEPGDGFYVQVSWDTDTDQDLHVMRAGGTLFKDPGDCNFCNMNPSWGTSGGTDDPSLDWDSIDGYGPETTTIDTPSPDSYTIAVHFYGQDGDIQCRWTCPPTKVTVRLFLRGTEVRSWNRTLNEAGEVWTVARLDWPAESITDVNSLTTTSLSGCY
jgi:hypothetical protein